MNLLDKKFSFTKIVLLEVLYLNGTTSCMWEELVIKVE